MNHQSPIFSSSGRYYDRLTDLPLLGLRAANYVRTTDYRRSQLSKLTQGQGWFKPNFAKGWIGLFGFKWF